MLRWIRVCVLLSFLAAAPSGAALVALGDFGSGPGSLLQIDTNTGAASVIASISGGPVGATWAGLAWDGTSLYSWNVSTDTLYSITLSGVATEVGVTGITDPEGYLAFSPSGTLYAGRQNFYSLDPGTGATTFIGTTDVDDASGLTFDALGNGYLLDTGVNTGGVPSLHALDPGTGDTTPIGSFGTAPAPFALGGIAFDGGQLYAVNNDVLYEVDSGTGAATEIGATGIYGVSGLTSAPIPEPGTGVLLGVGLIALAHRRRP